MSWPEVAGALGVGSVIGGGVVGAVQHGLTGRRERRTTNVQIRRAAYARLDEMAGLCASSLNGLAYGTEKSILRGEIATWSWDVVRRDLRDAQLRFEAPRAQFRLTVSDKVGAKVDGLASIVQAGSILMESIYSAAYWGRQDDQRRGWPEPVYEVTCPEGTPSSEAVEDMVHAIAESCQRLAETFEKELAELREQMKRELGTRSG